MEDSKNYEKSIKEMIDTMAAEKKTLIDENEQLKSENSDLKTQLETEQATVPFCIHMRIADYQIIVFRKLVVNRSETTDFCIIPGYKWFHNTCTGIHV